MSLTMEEIAGAVARGYCTTANMHKELDADLVTGITNEVMALLQSLSQEAVRDEAQLRADVIREIADRLANRTVPDLPGWREAISSDIAYIRSTIFE